MPVSAKWGPELVHFVIEERGNIRRFEDPRAAELEWFDFFASVTVFYICWNVQFIEVISSWL